MAGGRAGVTDLRGPRLLNATAKLAAVDLKAVLAREARTLGFDCVGVTDPDATADAAKHLRAFLAGDRLTYADLAAAAHLSAIYYLGDVPWHEDDAAKAWYARVKSRPSFRPLLSEWLAGVPASRTYVDLDF